MKLKLSKHTVLKKFKDKDTDAKLNILYYEIIKIKRRMRFLNEFQNMSLSRFVSKQVTDSNKDLNARLTKTNKDLGHLTRIHQRIKSNLSWQSEATKILKNKLYEKGVDKDELNEELQELHSKFIKDKERVRK